MATLQDIADALGITKGTVSKALNNAPDISDTLRKTVLETAVEMGYTRQRRVKNDAKKLCILINYMDYTEKHHFAYDILLGFRQMAEPEGYQVDVLRTDTHFQMHHPYEMFMLENDYLGAFVIGFSLNDPWMREFETTQRPTVLYDNYIAANPHTAYIGVDNQEGMELAIKYLKSLGHKKIGYLSSALGSYIMQQRYSAFFHAMRQHGLKADGTNVGATYHITECVGKHLPRMLELGMTAFLCSQDQIANAAIIHCQQLGYRVPEDISIIGHDDAPISAYTEPPLTTIRQDRLQLGKSGYYALTSLMNEVSIGTMLLHAKLIVRSSSGPAPSPKEPN